MGPTQTTRDKMAKGTGKGGAKTYACGGKGCYICMMVFGIILLVVGIVLIAMAATIWGDKKDTSSFSTLLTTATFATTATTTQPGNSFWTLAAPRAYRAAMSPACGVPALLSPSSESSWPASLFAAC